MAGAVALCLEMLLFSSLGMTWSLPLLLAPLLLAGAASVAIRRRRRAPSREESAETARALRGPLLLTLAALLLVAYVSGSARATSPDLLLFWGAKAERFGSARTLDTAYLAAPEHFLMHSDYPPLLPLLSAAGAMAAGKLPWGASLLALPLFVLFAALSFWAWARPSCGARAASELTALLTALLGYGLLVTLSAGNAEPPLLFFEVAALAAAVLGAAGRGTDFFISLALAGAVLTKFEGAVFAAILVPAVAGLARDRGRRIRSLLVLAALPSVCLAAWIAICARSGLLDAYKGGSMGALAPRWLPEVLKAIAASVSYDLAYLPWLLLAGLWLLGARHGGSGRRRSRLPIAVGCAAVLANVYFYLHGDADPALWVRWSAARTFLTPLLCLFFGAAAAAVPSSDGKENPADRVRMILEE